MLLALTVTSASAVRVLFSPLQEAAKADLRLDDFQISLVQGLAASIPIALMAVPVGRMTDRGRRVWLLAAMAVLWSVGSVMTAYADGFAWLFVARMLSGVGAVCALPVAISLAADLSAPERRGRSLLLLTLGTMVGGASAFAIGGALFGALGETPVLGLAPWRGVQLIFGLVSAVLVLPLLPMREPARREVVKDAAALGPALRELWALRGFLLPLFLGQIGVVMADTAATVWAAPILTRDFGQQPAQFAGWMGLAILGSGLVGSVLGGFAADAGQKAKSSGGVLYGAAIVSVLAIPAALFPIMPSVAGFGWVLAALLLAGSACGLITTTALAVLVPNEIRGVCVATFLVVASVVGLGLAPTLVTLGSDALGGETHLALSLAITGVAVNVLSALGFLIATRTAPRRVGA
nr:MFS transporter [Caulobacter sp. 17J65-9]